MGAIPDRMATVPPTNHSIAERVRAAMDAAGQSEVVLADATDIPRTTLRRRLSGRSNWMTSELTAICEHLDVPLLSLLSDETSVA